MRGRHYNVRPPVNGRSIPRWIVVKPEAIRLLIG